MKEGYSSQRRMLCTNDKLLLMSSPGQKVLNYKVPTGSMNYVPSHKNLIVTWDILLQNYRMISCESVDIVAVIKSAPADMFWKYFQEKILPMSGTEKARLMNN